ncbi:MAG: hypothetical protein RLZZ450_3524 [Pseudomonadota bacterium]|jgi:serine/threonine-protein kinase
MTGLLVRGHQAILSIDEALQLDVPDESVDALAPGQHIHHGQYHIHGVLGRGSFATVYDAEHLGLGRRVAIKVPLLNCDKKALLHERFVREARLSALVQHPNVLAIFDAGSLPDGTPFLVLERVEGDSLNERFAHGVLPIAEVIEIGRQMAMALTSLVAAGIVHRDVKPANVMLHRTGGEAYTVKLVDLGVAKRHSPFQAPMRLTMQGELIGTPQYMSSEQLRGEEVDARTDIYGAGAVLYEALTGKPPHESTCFSDYMVAALSQPVTPIRGLRSDCPPELERVLLQALECQPAKRQSSPEQLLAELDVCKLELEARDLARAAADRESAERATAVTTAPTPVPPAPSHAQKRRTSAAETVLGWVTATRRTVSRVPRMALAVGGLMLLLGGSLVGPSTLVVDQATVARPRAAAPKQVQRPAASGARADERAPLAQAPEARTVGGEPKPEVAEPEVAKPEDAEPEVAEPEVAEPEVAKLEDAKPEVAKLEDAKPEDAELEDAKPEDAEPERIRPAFAPRVRGVEETAPGPTTAQAPKNEDVRHKLAPVGPRAQRVSKASEVVLPIAVAQVGKQVAADKQPPHETSAPAATTVATPPPIAAKPAGRSNTPAPLAQSGADTQLAMANALKAFATGRLSEAKASYQQVLRANPSHPAALRGLGLVAATLGEPDAARHALRRYLQLTPNAPDAAQITARIQALGR